MKKEKKTNNFFLYKVENQSLIRILIQKIQGENQRFLTLYFSFSFYNK